MVSRKCPNNPDNTLVKRGDSQAIHYARKDHIENKRHLNCLNGAGKSHVMHFDGRREISTSQALLLFSI